MLNPSVRFLPTVLASVKRALKPAGRLVLVDFEREEGVATPWCAQCNDCSHLFPSLLSLPANCCRLLIAASAVVLQCAFSALPSRACADRCCCFACACRVLGHVRCGKAQVQLFDASAFVARSKFAFVSCVVCTGNCKTWESVLCCLSNHFLDHR
jgi:hypothetical protein